MSDQKIDINIKTTADTAGAKETEAAIKGVSSEVEDLNAANQKAAEEQRNAEQAADVRRIKTLALGKAIQEISSLTEKAAAAAHEYAKELGAVDPAGGREVEKIAEGLDLVTASANGAAAGMAALGPPGAVIGAVVAPALALLKQEATGAFESFAKLKEIEAIGAGLPAVFERVKAASLVKAQGESWQALLDKMIEVEKEAASLTRVAQAQRDLAEFAAKQQLTVTKAAGGDTGAAEKNLRAVQEQNFNAEQAEKVRPAEDALVKAQTELAISQGLAARSAEANTKEQQAMAQDISKYRKALVDAERALREAQTLSGIEREKFGIGNQTQDKVSEFQKKKADESVTVEGINSLVGAIGNGGSKELQDAARALAGMASDNVLTADELKRSGDLLAQFGNQIINLGKDQNGKLQELIPQIDELRREVANLKSNAKK